MSDANSTILSIQAGDELQGRYRLECILGRGGMGVVWKAFDTQLDKPVAIKLLPPEVGQDGRALERLKAEARRGQSLAHPGIVSLHDFQLDPRRGNAAFLVMEFVEGRTLSELLKDHPEGLPRKQVIAWAAQLAEAIDFAHAKKILHRDIKPGNIMIDESGNARLIDFGIGREVRNTMTEVSQRTDSSGTPAYMSPQQLMGENHPTNYVYSLAATLYECLCGTPPFRDGHVQTQILHKPASPIPGQPDSVNAALLAGLAKTTEARPISAHALATAMARVKKPQSTATRAAMDPPTTRTLLAMPSETSPQPISPSGVPAPAVATAHQLVTESGDLPLLDLYDSPVAPTPTGRGRPIVGLIAAIAVVTLLFWAVFRLVYDAQREAVPPSPQHEPTQSAPGHLARKPVEFAPGVTAEFVYIDAPGVAPDGFLMGSPATEEERGSDEIQHRVKLTKGFSMQTTEVTQAQWEAVMGTNPSSFKNGARYPVEQVSWEDCHQFSAKLGARGVAARLPTEAEWEFACRAGSTTPFSFGETISTDEANYDGNSSYGPGSMGVYREQTTAAGVFPANEWGLHDLHGNVWEWCEDSYGDYARGGVSTDPSGSQTGNHFVIRGGSYLYSPRYLRSASRDKSERGGRYRSVGFRLCLDSE